MSLKRTLLAAATLFVPLVGAPDLVFARTVFVPITLVGGVPVPCAMEKLGTCHNRWHFAIQPVATAEPGDTVVFQTRDALDNQFNRNSTAATVAAANLNRIHPLTGPVYIKGAQAGDVLAVTIEKIEPGPDRFGYTVIVPGFGFLRDVFPNPFIVRWDLQGSGPGSTGAVSKDMPGVRVPMNGFTGTIGVALGPNETATAFQREEQLRLAGGFVLPPEPSDAVPGAVCGAGAPFANGSTPCLRTIPPRENGGNMDVKQMIAGTTLLFPCFVDGCLLSTGDVHFAQGDGEVSGTAIEMNARVTVKVRVRKGGVALGVRQPEIEGKRIPGLLKKLEPKRFLATTGIPLKEPGNRTPQEFTDGTLAALTNVAEDVTLAARDALLNMIALLTGPRSPAPVKLSPEQAYILSSVAVDLRISNLVDVPNFLVTAILPLDVFRGERHDDHDDDDD
jgi:formamidase